MPPRPLIAVLALAACTSDDTPAADATTEADATTGDLVTTGTGTMSSGMTMDDDDDDDDDDDSTTTMGDDDDDDDSSSGDTGPTTCMTNDDCAGMGVQLFCIDDVCVDCSGAGADMACAELDDTRPACDNDSGACVECTSANDAFCDGDTPYCDTDASTCRECVEHSECPDSACKIRHDSETKGSVGLGRCFDPADVVTVNSDGTADFVDIFSAVNSLPGDGDLVIILEDDGDSYDENITVGMGDNQDIAILAAPGQDPNWIQGAPGGGSQLTVAPSGRVWLYDLRIATNANSNVTGVSVNGGRLHVQRSRIVGNTGGGISATAGAFAIVENSFVSGSGTAGAPAVGSENSDAVLLYSTLGRAFTTTGFVVDCTGGNVEVRNSLVVNQSSRAGNEVCLDATVTTSVQDTELDPGAEGWFSDFAGGDYDLEPTAPAAWLTTAIWLEGDPATDIDGTPRPTEDDSEDVVGAHIP